MGKMINTTGNELFPSIGPNGKLYFASDGHPGIGGLDIFYATRANQENTKETPAQWENPTNMMYPINSTANDYAMADFDGSKGYFTSERREGANKSYTPDIYSFTIPPLLFDLRVVVYEAGKKVKKLTEAKVVVTGSDGSIWEGLTNEKGTTIKWDKKQDGSRYINGEVNYSVIASKEKYFQNNKGAKCTTVGLDRNQSFLLEIPLLPKNELRTPEIRYYLDKWTFVDDNTIKSSDSLKFLDSLLTNYPDITIDLYSHTDARDTEKHNDALSDNRAKAVYVYLVDKVGIDPRRIRPEGKGESTPAKWIDETGKEQLLTEEYINQFKVSDKEKFEKLHQINRRTEVKITSENFNPLTAAPADPNWKIFTDPLPR
jgi:peptidoglycan-associated lipoprotein